MIKQTDHLLPNNLGQPLIKGLNNFKQIKMNASNRSLIVALCCIILILSGCKSSNPIVVYVNSKAGISMEKPDNWDNSYIDRDGVLLLWTKKDLRNTDSARIEIYGANCSTDTSNSSQPNSVTSEFFVQDIRRITRLYNQASVVTVQEPIIIENSTRTIMKATIKIPTIAMQDDLNRIQVGRPKPDIFQTVDIFSVSGNKYVFIAYLYEGNNSIINEQAQNIIFSIKRYCPAK